MRRYVEVHGGGSFEALTLKQGVSGGSGRGPVNTYNKVCYCVSHNLSFHAQECTLFDW